MILFTYRSENDPKTKEDLNGPPLSGSLSTVVG